MRKSHFTVKRYVFIQLVVTLVLFSVLLVSAIAVAGDIGMVNTGFNGELANGESGRPIISANGRYVAYTSTASNLVNGDTNSARDAFVTDIEEGVTRRVSTDSNGVQANGNCNHYYAPSISADGRYVAFESDASNLVPGDTNGKYDVFVKDTINGATTRISTVSDGGEANDSSGAPAISTDGRYIAFQSLATNLVTGDTNSAQDIFLKDTLTGNTKRVSTSSSGSQGDNGPGHILAASYRPSITSDGQYVAFTSSAHNFVSSTDQYSGSGCYLKNTQTGSIKIISQPHDSTGSSCGSVSADGSHVTYSQGLNRQFGGFSQPYINNIVSGKTERLSAGMPMTGSYNTGAAYGISADNRYVAISYFSGESVSGGNFRYQTYIVDRASGNYRMLSVDDLGDPGNSASYGGAISANGAYIAFYSEASNLVEGDSNGEMDVFLASNDFACDDITLSFEGNSDVYWSSYADYRMRLLTTVLTIDNDGFVNAYDFTITGIINTSGVQFLGNTISIDKIIAGESQDIVLQFRVPQGVESFMAFVEAEASNACGDVYYSY